jgi:hypothetical protein
MTTADYIPFINTANDCAIARHLYSDANAMRISLESIEKINANLPSGPKRWIDASIDGLHHSELSKLSEKYRGHVKKFDRYEQVADPQFQQTPDKQVVEQFVFSVLGFCKLYSPDWIGSDGRTSIKVEALFPEGLLCSVV